MARPEKHIPASLEEAMAELKRDPSHTVQARVDGFKVELRALPDEQTKVGLGTTLANVGPWDGISLEELAKVIRDGRESGGSAPPPEMP